MRVFVTGATGFIGSAIVRELLDAGHQVTGLARSDKSAAALTSAGAKVQRGSLEDVESLRQGAAGADGVIHTAFYHEISHMSTSTRFRVLLGGSPTGIGSRFMGAAVHADTRAVETLGATLAGSDRPLVITSAVGVVHPRRVATEDDAGDPGSFAAPRLVSERAALSLASKGVRASVVRLPSSVHGDGDHGFIPRLIAIARKKGVSAYVGEGDNLWPAVHRLDAVRLFRLALENGVAGARYHGVAEEGIPFRDIAAVIGKRLNVPVVSKSPAEAAKHFGMMGMFVTMDVPATSIQTQQRLEWHPTQPGLIPDVDRASYFKT
jgi:nucleoside-diphosphate-sugar epimerase